MTDDEQEEEGTSFTEFIDGTLALMMELFHAAHQDLTEQRKQGIREGIWFEASAPYPEQMRDTMGRFILLDSITAIANLVAAKAQWMVATGQQDQEGGQ